MLPWLQLCDSYQSYLNSLWTGTGHVRCFHPSNRLINMTWLLNSVIFPFSGWSVLPGRQWVSPVIPSLPGQNSFLPGGTETTAGMWPLYDWVGSWVSTGTTGVVVTSARLPMKCSYTCKTTYGLYNQGTITVHQPLLMRFHSRSFGVYLTGPGPLQEPPHLQELWGYLGLEVFALLIESRMRHYEKSAKQARSNSSSRRLLLSFITSMCTNQKTRRPPQLLPCPPLSWLVSTLSWFLLLAACPGGHGQNNRTMIMPRSKLVTLPRGPTLQGRPDHGEGWVRGVVPVKFLPPVSTRNSHIASVPCNIWLLVWTFGEMWYLTIVFVYVRSHISLRCLLISFQPPPQYCHLPFPHESPV